MRICIVCPHFPSPRLSENIDGIFRGKYIKMLRSYGHEVFIVTTKPSGTPSFENFGGVKIFRVSSYTISKIRYPIPAFSELIRTILKVVSQYDVDVIEFNNHLFLTALPIFLIRKMVKKPITISVDGLNGITYFYGDKVIDLVGLLYTFTLGLPMLKMADRIRLSHASLIRHLMRFGISRKKLHVIYNAVDVKVFHSGYDRDEKRKELGIAPNDIAVLYVGRLDRVKRVDYLIKMGMDLIKKHGNMKLILVGEGAMYETCKEIASDFERNIIFTGVRSDVAQIMNAADVFVLPSISEGCPNVILEAAAIGLPIVATTAGAVPEILMNNETGLLIPWKNTEKFKQALQTMIQNPEKAKKMGEKAREFVIRNFSLEVVGRRVNNFYQGVLKTSDVDEGG